MSRSSFREPLTGYGTNSNSDSMEIGEGGAYSRHGSKRSSSRSNGDNIADSSSSSSSFSPRFFRVGFAITALLSLVLLIVVIGLAIRDKEESGGGGGGNNNGGGSVSSSTGSGNGTSIPSLRDLVTYEHLFVHLSALQGIADQNGGNRMIANAGFNASLDYIWSVLTTETNFILQKQQFKLALTFEIADIPTFTMLDPVANVSFVFPNDFIVFGYSGGVVSNSLPLTVPTGVGCDASDYSNASPIPAAQAVVLVPRTSNCTSTVKANLAIAAGAIGYIEYIPSVDGLLPMAINWPSQQSIPLLCVSYTAGQILKLAAESSTPANPRLLAINLVIADVATVVNNICADTPTGDITSTIVIGSHCDSVLLGPGIGDNGSGTASNLVWAVGVSKLLQTPGYGLFPNRLRFCWWGAEEQGLKGSAYHVSVAMNSTTPGERLSDYQLNLNFDMTSTPNFVFGVLDAATATQNILPSVIPGSMAISELYINYFNKSNLPWDPKPFNGRSDYGSFLAAGLPAGGVSAFIDRVKTLEERDRYDSMLPGRGGIPDVPIDSCYHKACDSIHNINPFAITTITQANAEVLEILARMQPTALRKLMFPNSTDTQPPPLLKTLPEMPLYDYYE